MWTVNVNARENRRINSRHRRPRECSPVFVVKCELLWTRLRAGICFLKILFSDLKEALGKRSSGIWKSLVPSSFQALICVHLPFSFLDRASNHAVERVQALRCRAYTHGPWNTQVPFPKLRKVALSQMDHSFSLMQPFLGPEAWQAELQSDCSSHIALRPDTLARHILCAALVLHLL